MRKVSQFFLLLFIALMANSLDVGAQTTLLNQNFDNITSGVPTGWDNSDYDCGSNYKWNSDAGGDNGTRGMKFNTYSAQTNTYSALKTPVLNLNLPYVLRFKYNNFNAGQLDVRISFDGGATYNTVIASNLSTQSDEFVEVEYSLAPYVGHSNACIVFYGISNYGYHYQYLDDVVVETAPICKSPSGLYITNLGTNNATLNWSLSPEGEDPGLFQLTVKDENGSVVVSDNTILGTTTTYLLNGLSANTTYTVTMRSDCNDLFAGYSRYSTANFTTACFAMSVPYTENFDGLAGIPDCTSSLHASINSSTKYGTSGKSLELSTANSESAYMIFPLLNHAANDIEMGFYAKSSISSTLTYMVGIVSDPGDIEGTFEPLRIDSLTNNTTWEEIRMNTALASVSTSPVMMCIFVGSGTDASMFVDNVNIHQIPTCIRPEQFRAYNPTATSVDLAWSTSTATTHLVEVTDAAGTSQVVATTNPYTVTGLQSNSSYSFRIRAYCGGTDTSEYASATATAKTLCAPMTTAMWSEGAEQTSVNAIPECWTMGNFTAPSSGSGSIYTTDPFYTQTSTVHTGSRAFQLRDQRSGTISYLTSQGFTVDQANKYQASIWVYRPTGTNYAGEGLRLFASNSPDDVSAAQELGFINRMAGNTPVESGSGWFNYKYPISKTGVVYLIIQGESKWGSSTYFDDISVELAPTCFPSGDITVGVPTMTDNTISWTAGTSGETSWVLAYTLKSGNTVVATDSLVLTQPSYTFSSLTAATSYTLTARVYALCSPTDMADAKSITATFTTSCGSITTFPYTQDFEGGVVPPTCWSQAVLAGSNAWSASTSQKHGGSYSAYIPDDDAGTITTLTTGELVFNNPTGYQVSYWQYRTSSSYAQSKTNEAIHVYVSPNAVLDETTALEIGVVSNHYANAPAEAAAGWYQYTFNIPASVTGSQYVSFCYHNQWGSASYIDDVIIRPAPTCPDLPNPTITDILPTSAKVTISDTTATAWDISYGPTGTAAGAGTVITVTGTNEYTITGLTTNTTYDVYVRRNCGTEFGMWTLTPVSFTAACADLYATISDVDPYSFKVSTDASNWEISYGPLGTQAGGGTVVPVSGTNNYTITGLTPSTDYVLYVRRDCGSSTYSDWSYSYTVTTTSVPDSIPFNTGFEDSADNNKWTFVNGSSTTNVFTIGTDAAAVASGSKALYIQNGSSYGYSTGSSTKTYAYRTIYFGSGVHNVSFRWKCTGGEGSYTIYDFGRVMLVPGDKPITGGSGSSLSSTTFPEFVEAFDPEGKTYMSQETGDANGWNTYTGDIDMTGREGIYNFVVMWNNDGSQGNQYPISIDNISISQVSCPRPAVLSGSTGSTTTTITVASLIANQWEIAVSSTPIDVFGTVTGDIYQQVSSAPAVITGLTPNTEYYYTARIICGAGDTSRWADPQIVRTSCTAYSVPYTETFEDAGALTCWPSIGTELPSRNTSYKHAGTASCKITDATAVSPTMNVTSLATYMLNGWCYSTTDSVNFTVGVMVDPDDISTFIDLAQVSIPEGNEWTEFTTYFTLLSDPDYIDFADAQHFVIAVAGGSTVYIDDLYLGNTPTCPKPTETSIKNVLANTFDLSWTENGTATSWLVKAVPAAAGQATIDTVVTTNPAHISGLNAASTYTVQIQSICSAADSSLVTNCGTLRTTCDIVNLPYQETFETMTASTVPDCWDNSASTTPTATSTPSYVWGVYETGGNKMIRMNNYYVSSGLAVINTPVISLSSINPPTFSFDYCNQSSAGAMDVMISTNGGTSWTTLGTYSGTSGSYTSPSSWTNVSLNLGAYIGQNVIIRFSANANYGTGAIFVDNINILEGRACATPSDLAAVSAPTGNSVQISWTPGGTETQWLVRTSQGSNVSYQTATTNPYTVTGLNASSNYSISVAALCAAGDTSYFCAPISITTACAVVNAPYSEDFESMTANATPNCWDISASTTSTATTSSSYYVWGVYEYSGNKMIRMRDYLVQDGDAIINSPAISLPALPYAALEFDYSHTSTTAGDLEVYASSNNGTSWTLLGSYGTNGGGSYDYGETPGDMEHIELSLAGYAGNNVIIRFASQADYGYGAIFVDNVEVTMQSSCAKVMGVNVNPADTFVSVNIVDTIASHTQWQYMFGVAGFDTTGVVPVLTDSTTLTIGGLTSRVSYDIYVRAYCDATEQSSWTRKTFTTTGTPASFPYVCQFTDPAENAQWMYATSYTTGNQFTIGTDANACSTGNTAALYVSGNASTYGYTNNSASACAAYRLFRFDPSQYTISFSWKCDGGESSYDYGRFYIVPATEPVYLPSGSGTYSSSGWPTDMIALDGGSYVNKTNYTSRWYNVDTILDMSNRAGSYYLIFIWNNDYSTGTNYPLAVNDIRIAELSCLSPANVTVPAATITETSVEVNYSDMNGGGTDVRYWINTTGNRADTLASGVVNASPFTISGLSSSTKYYLFMKSECTPTDESPVVTVRFATTCGAISTFPFTEGFEDTEFAPNCWSAPVSADGAVWNRYTTTSTSNYIHTGRGSAHLTNASTGKSALLATPPLQLDSLREYYVSFYMYRAVSTYYTDAVKAYLSDYPTTIAGATLLSSTVCKGVTTAGMYQVSFDIPSYTSGIKYIVFQGEYNYNGYVYIDDVTVDIYPTCRDLNGVTVDYTTATTMTVSADKGPNHQGIIFAYAPATATSVADTIGSVYSTTGTAVISGLTNSTTYKVYARGVCSATDSTAWTSAATGTTKASDCFEPQNLHIVGLVNATEVTLVWGGAPLANAYEYQCVGTSISGTVTSDTLLLTGLTPRTSYNFQVRTLCAQDTSAWVSLSFTTISVPAPLPYICDFEDAAEANMWEFENGSQTNYFMVGTATSNGGSSSLYITNDGSANTYTTSSAISVVIAKRLFQLQAGQYAYSYDWNCYGESTYDYGRAFIVPSTFTFTPGTLPSGVSTTGVPAGGYALDGNSKLNLNQSGAWVNVSDFVTITNSGNYLMVFLWRNDGSSGTNPPLAVDNIQFQMLTCPQPTVTVVPSSITENSASVAVSNPTQSDTLIYAVSVGSVDDAFMIDTVIGQNTINITGLAGSSTYNVYVKVHCSADDESFYSKATFRTLCGSAALPYFQGFEDIPTTYSGPGMIESICWNDLNASSSSSSYPNYKAIGSGYSDPTPTEGSYTLKTFSSTSTPLFLILPSFGDITNCRVSFDAAYESLTNSGTFYVGYMTNPSVASSFVSSYTVTATTTKTLEPHEADIANIPAGARIAFQYSAAPSQSWYGWLDNIRVSQLVQGPTYADTICFGEPYTNRGFNVDASDLVVGNNSLTRLKAGSVGNPDTIITANVYQRPNIEVITYDTLCKGEPLVWGGRVFQNPKPRAYIQPVITSSTGCDSLNILYLTVIPTYNEVNDTICRGDVYPFGGQNLTDPGDYTHIGLSPRGCMDTTLLHLAVIETRDTLYDAICSGSVYTWHGQQYSTAGTYTWSGTGAHGCPRNEWLVLTVTTSDSTVITSFCHGGMVQVADTFIQTPGTYTLTRYNPTIGCSITYHITATEDPIKTGYATDQACEDHLYTGFGLWGVVITKDTTFTQQRRTYDGMCDSLVNVSVTLIHTVWARTEEVSIDEGDSYEWHGTTYNTPTWKRDTLQSVVTGCDSICTLSLTVGGVSPVGVETVQLMNVSLIPNPVNAGQTSFIYGNFDDVKSVEVLNSFGQVIDTFVPETYPIEVQGINAAGIYYVRITTTDDQIAVEKLIVK